MPCPELLDTCLVRVGRSLVRSLVRCWGCGCTIHFRFLFVSILFHLSSSSPPSLNVTERPENRSLTFVFCFLCLLCIRGSSTSTSNLERQLNLGTSMSTSTNIADRQRRTSDFECVERPSTIGVYISILDPSSLRFFVTVVLFFAAWSSWSSWYYDRRRPLCHPYRPHRIRPNQAK